MNDPSPPEACDPHPCTGERVADGSGCGAVAGGADRITDAASQRVTIFPWTPRPACSSTASRILSTGIRRLPVRLALKCVPGSRLYRGRSGWVSPRGVKGGVRSRWCEWCARAGRRGARRRAAASRPAVRPRRPVVRVQGVGGVGTQFGQEPMRVGVHGRPRPGVVETNPEGPLLDGEPGVRPKSGTASRPCRRVPAGAPRGRSRGACLSGSFECPGSTVVDPSTSCL